MVNTRRTTSSGDDETAFNAAVAAAVQALLLDLTASITNEIRRTGTSGGSGGDVPPTMHVWLEQFGKQKPKSFSTANTPVDAENWVAHVEKIFEVLGCADEFKARLASYKLEGDALSWWKAFKQAKGGYVFVATMTWQEFRDAFFLQYFPRSEQQKYEREYHTIRQLEDETTGEFMKRFLHLAGFLGAKAGTHEDQAKNFKWALNDWILDGIVNTEFTDVAHVANAARNIEILRERSKNSNKRNMEGDKIQPALSPTPVNTPRVQDQRNYDRRGDNNQRFRRDRGQHFNRASGSGFGSSNQKRFPNQANSPPCATCGKLHPGKPCHRVTGGCFSCGVVGHQVRECPKNDGKGNGRQPSAKGRVFALTRDQAATASGNKRDAGHE